MRTCKRFSDTVRNNLKRIMENSNELETETACIVDFDNKDILDFVSLHTEKFRSSVSLNKRTKKVEANIALIADINKLFEKPELKELEREFTMCRLAQIHEVSGTFEDDAGFLFLEGCKNTPELWRKLRSRVA